MKEPALIARLATDALQLAREKFTVQRMAAAMEQVFRSASNQARQR
jgi:hypothetical protein